MTGIPPVNVQPISCLVVPDLRNRKGGVVITPKWRFYTTCSLAKATRRTHVSWLACISSAHTCDGHHDVLGCGLTAAGLCRGALDLSSDVLRRSGGSGSGGGRHTLRQRGGCCRGGRRALSGRRSGGRGGGAGLQVGQKLRRTRECYGGSSRGLPGSCAHSATLWLRGLLQLPRVAWSRHHGHWAIKKASEHIHAFRRKRKK